MALFGSFIKRAISQATRTRAPLVQPPHLGKGLPPELPYGQQPMNAIQVPDLTRKLVTRYGLREKAPAPTLAPEVQPVVLVDDLVGESDLIKPRIRPCAASATLTTAASVGLVGFVNPAGSNVVAHLSYCMIGGASAGNFTLHMTPNPVATNLVLGAFRNGLLQGAPACKIAVQPSSAGPGGTIVARIRHNPGIMFAIPFDAVIDESDGLQFWAVSSGTATFETTWVWTEEDKR